MDDYFGKFIVVTTLCADKWLLTVQYHVRNALSHTSSERLSL